MPFWKKKATQKKRGNQSSSAGDPHHQDLTPVKREPWKQPEPDPGLPGTSGYFDGIKAGPHPRRFKYVRPDGEPDGPAPTNDPDGPPVPSQRPVPRGFFGP